MFCACSANVVHRTAPCYPISIVQNICAFAATACLQRENRRRHHRVLLVLQLRRRMSRSSIRAQGLANLGYVGRTHVLGACTASRGVDRDHNASVIAHKGDCASPHTRHTYIRGRAAPVSCVMARATCRCRAECRFARAQECRASRCTKYGRAARLCTLLTRQASQAPSGGRVGRTSRVRPALAMPRFRHARLLRQKRAFSCQRGASRSWCRWSAICGARCMQCDIFAPLLRRRKCCTG